MPKTGRTAGSETENNDRSHLFLKSVNIFPLNIIKRNSLYNLYMSLLQGSEI